MLIWFSLSSFFFFLAQNDAATLNRQENEMNKMLSDKSVLIMNLPEADSSVLNQATDSAKQSIVSARNQLNNTQR